MENTYAEAGSLQSLICSSNGGSPAPTLKWYRNDKEVSLNVWWNIWYHDTGTKYLPLSTARAHVSMLWKIETGYWYQIGTRTYAFLTRLQSEHNLHSIPIGFTNDGGIFFLTIIKTLCFNFSSISLNIKTTKESKCCESVDFSREFFSPLFEIAVVFYTENMAFAVDM